MVTLDLAELSVFARRTSSYATGEAGEDVEVLNPDARHHIGVGLTAPIRVTVKGSAGYFCAGLTDQAHFTVTHNVGWGVGDNMYSGSVVVGGNAGAIPGLAIRGARLLSRAIWARAPGK